MLVLCGRNTVELTRDTLRAIDSAGPFRAVRKAKREDIRRFEVKVSDGRSAPGFLKILNRMGGLNAEFDDTKPMPVAVGYPREWLVALGDELRQHINETNVLSAQSSLPATSEVVKPLSSELVAPLMSDDVLVQPKSSAVRLDQTADGVTLTVPPAGIWRGSKGLLLFGLVWCGFMTLFTGVVVFTASKPNAPLLIFGLFIAVFWAIGIAMLLGAINMGRRRAVFIVTPSDLRIAQQSLFKKMVWTWSREELTAIRVDRSGTEVNHRPILNLQIHSPTQRKVGLFSGRDEMELQWIATVLRQQLRVPAVT